MWSFREVAAAYFSAATAQRPSARTTVLAVSGHAFAPGTHTHSTTHHATCSSTSTTTRTARRGFRSRPHRRLSHHARHHRRAVRHRRHARLTWTKGATDGAMSARYITTGTQCANARRASKATARAHSTKCCGSPLTSQRPQSSSTGPTAPTTVRLCSVQVDVDSLLLNFTASRQHPQSLGQYSSVAEKSHSLNYVLHGVHTYPCVTTVNSQLWKPPSPSLDSATVLCTRQTRQRARASEPAGAVSRSPSATSQDVAVREVFA